MDMRQLRYFCAVFEQQNLSHAAQRCNVAQSAISHHIANLEAGLGVKLFSRLPRGMEPTPAGARLYEHAQSLFRSLDAAEQDIRHMADEPVGEIGVAMPNTIVEAVGVELIRRTLERYPKARLVVHEGISSEVFRQLTLGEADLCLCYNAPADERVTWTEVLEERICAVGRPEFLGASDAPIPFEDLLSLPHIMLQRGPPSRAISTQGRLLQTLHDRAVVELNSVNGMRLALVAAIGVATCPAVTVRRLIDEGQVVAREIVDPPVTRILSVGRLSGRLPTRLMEGVTALIGELIAARVASGYWPARMLG
jgi:LysR family nitrogen assimilation transcriptional regulator